MDEKIVSFLKKKDYVVLNEKLGGGSFGKTVLLKDPFIDELFVAKKYEPCFESIKEKFYKNFLDEIKILYKLNHQNVVRIYNYYAYEQYYTGYILMEYIEGQTIKEFINDYYDFFADISIDNIFYQTIDAFCYIESHNVIHRDIREGNIMVDKNGVVKIIDFGIGKMLLQSDEQNSDSLVSQINRNGLCALPKEYFNRTYTSKTDMFYLGELFYRLIKESPNNEFIDFSYDNILEKMMKINPKERYSSFSEIKDEIEKRKFSSLEMSNEDQETYLVFSNKLFEIIATYKNEKRFNRDVKAFIAGLEKVLENNLFEEIIQNNEDLINCLVLSDYTYYTFNMQREVVQNFLFWFKQFSVESQILILNNLIYKISNKELSMEIDLPF